MARGENSRAPSMQKGRGDKSSPDQQAVSNSSQPEQAPEAGGDEPPDPEEPEPSEGRTPNGQFAKGNRFWEARSSHGSKPIFEKPEDLLAACLEFVMWCHENPLQEEKVFHSAGLITRAIINKMRAMTIGGLCIFLDIQVTSWDNYRVKSDFLGVCGIVEEIIRNQKFTGAAADMLNPSIIARDLGLADKKELTGVDGKDLVPEDLVNDRRELAKRVAFMIAEELHLKEQEQKEQ